MTKVTITAEQPDSPDTLFRASAMEIESVGRERGETLSSEARAELEALVDSELDGSARRAAAMVSVGFS